MSMRSYRRRITFDGNWPRNHRCVGPDRRVWLRKNKSPKNQKPRLDRFASVEIAIVFIFLLMCVF